MKLQANGYSRELVLELLKSSEEYYEGRTITRQEHALRRVIGTLYRNAPETDILTVDLASTRLGLSAIDHSSIIQGPLLRDELLLQSKIVANAVDLLALSIIDRESFGNGKDTVESIASQIESPTVCLSNEIFSSQGGLSELLGLKQHFGEIEGKEVLLTWGFGSRFALPNLAHSLLLFLTLLGANVRVSAPSKFGLLNRVKHGAREIASESGSSLTFSDEFESVNQDTDAVIALNWCRLDDFQKPERNREFAQEHKDWFFSNDLIPENCAFLSTPPIQTDLLADKKLIAKSASLHTGWLKRRVAVLASTIIRLQAPISEDNPLQLL